METGNIDTDLVQIPFCIIFGCNEYNNQQYSMRLRKYYLIYQLFAKYLEIIINEINLRTNTNWTDYTFNNTKILQNLDHNNALVTHSYRCKMQQAQGIVIDKCPKLTKYKDIIENLYKTFSVHQHKIWKQLQNRQLETSLNF